MPAGGMALSANDLAQWLKIQLGHGALPGGGRLFSEAQAPRCGRASPSSRSPIPGSLAPLTPKFSSYALGWNVADYRGAKIISHGGGVFGSITQVILLPDQDVGIAVVVNSEEVAFLRGVAAHAGRSLSRRARDQDWPALFGEFMSNASPAARRRSRAPRPRPPRSARRCRSNATPAPIAIAWYGDVAVTGGADGLRIDFKTTPRMAGKLVHWQYDTFVTRFDDKAIEPAYVTFALDADGKVERVTMKPESPIADFSYDYRDLDLRPVGVAK
jgi:hypothetical protein